MPKKAILDKFSEIMVEGKLPFVLFKMKIQYYHYSCQVARIIPFLNVRLYQGSTDSGEFHAHVVKITKRCKFPCAKAEERAIRDTIFLGMNSTRARDKDINLMNEEGKELPVEFLIQQLEIEDCNAYHKSLSQLDSSTSIIFAAYDHRQNKAESNKKK